MSGPAGIRVGPSIQPAQGHPVGVMAFQKFATVPEVSAAVQAVTKFSVSAGETLHEEWLEFYGDLFVRFRDFVTIVPNPENTRCGCDVKEAGFTDASKERIVRETGTHYQIPSKVEVGLEELAIY